MITIDSCDRWSSHTSHTGPPFALWSFRDGASVLLCKGALDVWLDNADEDTFMEPTELTFLDRPA